MRLHPVLRTGRKVPWWEFGRGGGSNSWHRVRSKDKDPHFRARGFSPSSFSSFLSVCCVRSTGFPAIQQLKMIGDNRPVSSCLQLLFLPATTSTKTGDGDSLQCVFYPYDHVIHGEGKGVPLLSLLDL